MLLSGLFSGCEMAFVTSDRVRVELDTNRGGIIGRILSRFYSNSELFISTILVGNNVVLVVYGMGAAVLLEPLLASWFSSEAMVLTAQTLISTFVILLTGEFFPKTVFGINPNSSLKIVAVPLYLIYLILYPLSVFTAWLSKVLMRFAGIKDADRKPMNIISIGELNEYIEETIDDMEEQKQTVDNEVRFFRNALDFSTTHVRDCMTPRNEIVAVNIEGTTRDHLVELFISTGRSKIIVYRDDIDTVLGYIHVSELFDPANDWRKNIKPVLYSPENLLANTMMRRLLQQKRSIAIVVDEFGGTAGMLTSRTSWRKSAATSRTSTTPAASPSAKSNRASMSSPDAAKSPKSTSASISSCPRTTPTRPSPAISSTAPAPSPPRGRRSISAASASGFSGRAPVASK